MRTWNFHWGGVILKSLTGSDSITRENYAANPYYEAAGINERKPGLNTRIFDKPGGSSITGFAKAFVKKDCPKATKVEFTARFKTYLVIDDKTNYVVNWEAVTTYDVPTGVTSDVDYNTGDCGNANALPEQLKNILDASYAGNKIQ